VLTAADAGLLGHLDSDYVDAANRQGRPLLTLNKKHFAKPAVLATLQSVILMVVVHPVNPNRITDLVRKFLGVVPAPPVPSLIRVSAHGYRIITPTSDEQHPF
jgi:hypothetical protein